MAGLAQRVGVPIPALLWWSPGALPPKGDLDGGSRGCLGVFEAWKAKKCRQNPSGKVLFSFHTISSSVCLSLSVCPFAAVSSSHTNDNPGYCLP